MNVLPGFCVGCGHGPNAHDTPQGCVGAKGRHFDPTALKVDKLGNVKLGNVVGRQTGHKDDPECGCRVFALLPMP